MLALLLPVTRLIRVAYGPFQLGNLERGEVEEVNGKILRAAISVTLVGIFVKLAATSKEFVVAGVYGRSDAMDAFLAASLIPNLLVNVFAESMNQALVPTLVRVRMQQGQRKAQELLSSSMLWMCILLVLACTAMAVSARAFFPLLTWSFPAAKFELCLHLFWAAASHGASGGDRQQLHGGT